MALLRPLQSLPTPIPHLLPPPMPQISTIKTEITALLDRHLHLLMKVLLLLWEIRLMDKVRQRLLVKHKESRDLEVPLMKRISSVIVVVRGGLHEDILLLLSWGREMGMVGIGLGYSDFRL